MAASRKFPESLPIMESQQDSGDEEKMERFFELMRDMRKARSRMMRLQEREVVGGRRRKVGCCCSEGEGRSWVPKFKAEDFGVNTESGVAVTEGEVGVRDKIEEDGSGLNLRLTL